MYTKGKNKLIHSLIGCDFAPSWVLSENLVYFFEVER